MKQRQKRVLVDQGHGSCSFHSNYTFHYGNSYRHPNVRRNRRRRYEQWDRDIKPIDYDCRWYYRKKQFRRWQWKRYSRLSNHDMSMTADDRATAIRFSCRPIIVVVRRTHCGERTISRYQMNVRADTSGQLITDHIPVGRCVRAGSIKTSAKISNASLLLGYFFGFRVKSFEEAVRFESRDDDWIRWRLSSVFIIFIYTVYYWTTHIFHVIFHRHEKISARVFRFENAAWSRTKIENRAECVCALGRYPLIRISSPTLRKWVRAFIRLESLRTVSVSKQAPLSWRHWPVNNGRDLSVWKFIPVRKLNWREIAVCVPFSTTRLSRGIKIFFLRFRKHCVTPSIIHILSVV